MDEMQQKRTILEYFQVHGSLRRAMKTATVPPRILSIWCNRDAGFFKTLSGLIAQHGDDRHVKQPQADTGGAPAAVKINKAKRKDPTAAARMRKYRGRRRGQLSSLAARMRRAGFKTITADHLEGAWKAQEGKCWLSGAKLLTDGSDHHVACTVVRLEEKATLVLVTRWARAMYAGGGSSLLTLGARCRLLLGNLKNAQRHP